MLTPSIFNDPFLNDSLLDGFFGHPYGESTYSGSGLMSTDIKEKENEYELDVNLPGIKKENVKAELKNGYMTITASTNTDNDVKDNSGKYIRRERFQGNCSRSYYVGEDVKQEDIKAKFENGTLILTIPKPDKKPKVEGSNYISID